MLPVTRHFRYWYANGWWGDQGNSPHCVAYATRHVIEDSPSLRPGDPIRGDLTDAYAWMQRNDQWPGEDYEGTSVRAGARWAVAHGHATSYTFAWDLDTVVQAILTTGPVILGVNWYYDMFEPDAKDVIRLGGGIAGGHAIEANGATTNYDYVRIKNSWGRSWGNKGHAWIGFADLARLLSEDGEACLLRH